MIYTANKTDFCLHVFSMLFFLQSQSSDEEEEAEGNRKIKAKVQISFRLQTETDGTLASFTETLFQLIFQLSVFLLVWSCQIKILLPPQQLSDV